MWKADYGGERKGLYIDDWKNFLQTDILHISFFCLPHSPWTGLEDEGHRTASLVLLCNKVRRTHRCHESHPGCYFSTNADTNNFLHSHLTLTLQNPSQILLAISPWCHFPNDIASPLHTISRKRVMCVWGENQKGGGLWWSPYIWILTQMCIDYGFHTGLFQRQNIKNGVLFLLPIPGSVFDFLLVAQMKSFLCHSFWA